MDFPTIRANLGIKSKSGGNGGLIETDTLMDGDDCVQQRNCRVEIIFNRLVSVSNDALQYCAKHTGSFDKNSNCGNGIILSQIQNRSDVIDVDESELQTIVQQCTQEASDDIQDNNANEPFLETQLSKRYIIGRKPIINHCINTKKSGNNNKNTVCNLQLLRGIVNIR